MLCVVAPVLHKLPVGCEDVKTTLPPWQKVVGPPAEMLMVHDCTVTVVAAEGDEVHPLVVTTTV